MARSNVHLVLLVAVLITLNSHSSQAATKITKCWEGWATGKDLMKTTRNTTEKTCAANTKYCSKWYLMTGRHGQTLNKATENN